MDVGNMVKDALVRMLDAGEFEKIAKSRPEHAERARRFAEYVADAEGRGQHPRLSSGMGEGLRAVPFAALLGELGRDEPILADALCCMMAGEAE